MNIKQYVWIAPFLSFLAGYLVLQRISHVNSFKTPALVGQSLQPAIATLSAHNLNVCLITQKEDPDLPQGTILSQTPQAGQVIKPHQSVYIVISKKPQKIAAPLLINKSHTIINKELDALGIRNKTYYLTSNRPCHSCIAQLPAAGIQLEENKIITYFSGGNDRPALIPNLKGKSVPDVIAFLQQYTNLPEIIHITKQHENHTCNAKCTVVDQRPLAGSIITLNPHKTPLIQLQVR